MSMGDAIGTLWPIFIPHLPIYLVWIAGIALALVLWRKHPRVSALALVAFALLLIVSLAATFLSNYWQITLREQGMTTPQINRILGFGGIVTGLLLAGAWVVLVVALFIGRRRA